MFINVIGLIFKQSLSTDTYYFINLNSFISLKKETKIVTYGEIGDIFNAVDVVGIQFDMSFKKCRISGIHRRGVDSHSHNPVARYRSVATDELSRIFPNSLKVYLYKN